MREYNYTDYAINNANSEAIVYRFANGKVREITVDDLTVMSLLSALGKHFLTEIITVRKSRLAEHQEKM